MEDKTRNVSATQASPVEGVKCPVYKEKGTTISVAIGSEETQEIYYCGDGRSLNVDNLIISGVGVKHVEQDGLVFTLCGDNDIFVPWYESALDFLDEYEGSDDDDDEEPRVRKLLQHLLDFQAEWMDENPSRVFKAEMMVFGIINGKRGIFHFWNGDHKIITEVNHHASTVSDGAADQHGLGGWQANNHLTKFLRGNLTRETYMRILTEGITIAGLYNHPTGSYVETCAFGNTVEGVFGCLEKEKEKSRHTLKNLAIYYEVIEEEKHLQNCLIFITIDLPYDRSVENVFRVLVMAPFGEDEERIVEINVLGLNLMKEVTIRLVRYEDNLAYNRWPKIAKKD